MRSAVAAAAAMILAVGCGTAPSPSPSSTATRPASASVPPAATSSTPGGSGTAVTADPSLLAVVPAAAAGLQLDYDPDTTASVAADPALAADVEALAIGLAVPIGQATPAELVITSVVRLRDPGSDDEWFRSWRDTYDQAACEQAGGVSGHAQSEFNGHVVYIGSCAGGATTYHVRLGAGALVMSLTSIGSSRLGERIVRELTP